MSTWPTTLDDLQPVPTLQSDTPTHDVVHDAERAAINALQAGVGTAGTSRLVQRFADSAARDAAIPAPTAGMVCSVAGSLETNVDGTLAGWGPVSTHWITYTPSLENVILGNGTIDFRYRLSGPDTIDVAGTLTLGSTSSVSGLIGFGLPPGWSGVTGFGRSLGTAWIIDVTGPDFIATTQTTGGSSNIFVYSVGLAPTTASSPFVWAAGDQITVAHSCPVVPA